MSIQPSCPSDLPQRVRCEILGVDVVATVISTTLEANTLGPRDILLVEHEGSRYRVDAADATPA